MPFRRLLVWVEGSDDETFFNRVAKPFLQQTYDWVEVRAYRALKKAKLRQICRVFRHIQGAECIFTGDLDAAPCVTAAKDRLSGHYPYVENRCIFVIVQEIESWYLAGLSDDAFTELGIVRLANTDTVTKEQFASLVPNRFRSRLDFMSEILQRFSVDVAQQRNRSFRYFAERCLLRT